MSTVTRVNPMQKADQSTSADEGYVNPRDVRPTFYCNLNFLNKEGTESMGKLGERGLPVKAIGDLNKAICELLENDPQLLDSESEIRSKIASRIQVTIGMNVNGRAIAIDL